MPVIEDLQQHVEDLVVGLLDLVQQNQAVRLAPDGIGELATVVVADVARGCPDQSGDAVTLHELRHVETDHVLVGSEHKLREGPSQLRLAHPCGPQEHEYTNGPTRILEPRAGTAHGLRQRFDRLVLPHDTVVDRFLHLQQALGFLRRDLHQRNARPHRDDLRDVLMGDDRFVVGALGVEVFLQLLDPLLQFEFTIS